MSFFFVCVCEMVAQKDEPTTYGVYSWGMYLHIGPRKVYKE